MRHPSAGAQAPRLRVPLAAGTLVATRDRPDTGMIPSMLALSDVMSTGWFAADAANVKPGATVAIVGDGAVGLLGVLSAKQMGAERIIAMSRHAPRQTLAREFGATDIVTSVAVCGVLAVLTLLASTAPVVIVIAFWAALAVLFTVWVGLPWRRVMPGQVPVLEAALRASRARVIRIQSPRVVEFEEEEARAIFSIVEILGETGAPIDWRIVPHGEKLTPRTRHPCGVEAGARAAGSSRRRPGSARAH